MATQINPTIRRRRLGSELRKLREARGMTSEEVASALLVSQSKISRLENGRRSISPRDVRDLCQVYGVNDAALVEGLMSMARESRQRGWWHEFGDITYSVYIGLEADAAQIFNYESLIIPGLLQTQAYAEALEVAVQPEETGSERRVAVRMKRKDRLTGENPLRFWAVMDEAALRRMVGGPATMREQLTHLLEITELKHVTIQVLPFDKGAHPGMMGSFSLVEFPDSADSSVVYVEGVTGDLYLEREADVRRYTVMYEHLRAEALGTTETQELIARMSEELADDGAGQEYRGALAEE
ncbi:helix-turn-helix domain-containing protein [Allostreptomyces psammosilenae]|uniref:Transcriptional regulator with XRE-family HTH domain n=1 Tax=Allostreptomyces psammosilenae TaxID=1892865 RepID=A0A853AB82_9ACTN|nr:helix-turn-helix transcriptional regulator [Allostreptomyces psammosilenae]NYI07758.1 transcriptional regulator with XRE-family HTH domain [Allostreptomyces psammosilenae]